jgi:hypothetical protein
MCASFMDAARSGGTGILPGSRESRDNQPHSQRSTDRCAMAFGSFAVDSSIASRPERQDEIAQLGKADTVTREKYLLRHCQVSL